MEGAEEAACWGEQVRRRGRPAAAMALHLLTAPLQTHVINKESIAKFAGGRKRSLEVAACVQSEPHKCARVDFCSRPQVPAPAVCGVLSMELVSLITRVLRFAHSISPAESSALARWVDDCEGLRNLGVSYSAAWELVVRDRRAELRDLVADLARFGARSATPAHRTLKDQFASSHPGAYPPLRTAETVMAAAIPQLLEKMVATNNLRTALQAVRALKHARQSIASGLTEVKDSEDDGVVPTRISSQAHPILYANKAPAAAVPLVLSATPAEQFKYALACMDAKVSSLMPGAPPLWRRPLVKDDPNECSPPSKQMVLTKAVTGAVELEIARAEARVAALQKASMWEEKLDDVVDLLSRTLLCLHSIFFNSSSSSKDVDASDVQVAVRAVRANSSGEAGLALSFANAIVAIDDMVNHPTTVSLTARDDLFAMLSAPVKRAVKARLRCSDVKLNVHVLAQRLRSQLSWAAPLARNTTKYVTDGGPRGSGAVLKIHTLHYAQHEATENLIVNLISDLHHVLRNLQSASPPVSRRFAVKMHRM
eukprot:jgi/Chlat1/2026/Chrsp159S00131